MRRVIFITMALLMLCSIAGCSTKQAGDDSTIVVNLKDVTQKDALLSDIVDSITYLSLETSDTSLLGKVKDVVWLDSLFVLLDSKASRVLVFGIDGKFKREIGRSGMGPGEYLEPSQIDFAPSVQELLIYDRVGGKVLHYSLDGELRRSVPTLAFAYDFAYDESNGHGAYWFVNNMARKEEAGISCHDLAGDVISLKVPRSMNYESTCYREFFRCDDSLSVMSAPFSNSMYRIIGDSILSSLAFEILPSPTDRDLQHLSNGNQYGFIRTSHTETPRFLQIAFWSGEYGVRKIIFDKTSGDYSVVEFSRNDFDGPAIIEYYPVCKNNIQLALAEPDNPDDNPRLAFVYYRLHLND